MWNNNPVTLLFLCGLLLVLPIVSFGQDENVRGAVKSDDGLLIVWNEPNNNFTLNVKGLEIERVPNKNLAFLFDGKFLQIVSALKSAFLTEVQIKQPLDEAAILTAHRDWEAKYLSETIGDKLKIESEQLKLSDGNTVFLWSFVPPKNSGTVQKQFFLSTAVRESVIVLNGASTSTISEKTVRAFLLETIGTLRLTDKPLSQADAVRLASKKN